MATATGIFHRSYRSELALRQTKAEYLRLVLMVLVAIAVPFVANFYWLSIVNEILIAVVGAVGLNILVGYTGQISLGTGGFLAIGAYTSALLYERAQLPAVLSIAGAVLLTAAAGALLGLPALRLKGFYLALATLAAQVIIIHVAKTWGWLTGPGDVLSLRPMELFGWQVGGALGKVEWYVVLLVIATLAVLAGRNLFRTDLGRSFMAVRDQDTAAAAMGVNVTRAKVMAFAVSSAFIGLAGALTAHFALVVTHYQFTLKISILYLAMIIVGGLGSMAGAVYGAIFLSLLPPFLTWLSSSVQDSLPSLAQQLPALQTAVLGLVIILFLIFEPRGLNQIWQRVKDYGRTWPFRY